MTITVKLKDLVASQQSLMELGELTDIPAATSFRVARAIRKAKNEYVTFEETRRKLLKDSGVAEPHPGIPNALYVDPAKHPAALEALDAQVTGLMDATIDIEVNPIKLNEFATAKLKPNWLAALDWLIVE